MQQKSDLISYRVRNVPTRKNKLISVLEEEQITNLIGAKFFAEATFLWLTTDIGS